MFSHNLPLVSCLEDISESKLYHSFFIRPLCLHFGKYQHL
jgi:hypothetical protein